MTATVALSVFLLLAAGAPTAYGETSSNCASVAATPAVNRRLAEIENMRKALRFDEARRSVEALLQAYPSTFRVRYVAALVQADQKDWAHAEATLHTAIDLQNACKGTPGFVPDYTVYNTLGWLQMSQGRAADAETSYKQALTYSSYLTDASIARTKSNLGYLYFSQGNFEKARPLLTDAATGGNQTAVGVLNTMDKAEASYQAQQQEVPRFKLYYVIALTSDSRADMDHAIQSVKNRLGSSQFSQQFPNIEVYRPSDEYPYTLLLNSKPLPPAAASQLKTRAVAAGFSKDTWLWGSDVDYFSPRK